MQNLIRLVVAWAAVVLFWFFGGAILGDLSSPLWAISIFVALFSVIMWTAFGVVHEAE
ncbi:MAG: calcium:proton antiporter, partial [Proteobacteria bacterium]